MFLCKNDLIQGDLLGGRILQVPYAAAGETFPQDLEFIEDLLDFGKNKFDNPGLSRHLQNINVLRHDAPQFAVVPSEAKLRDNFAGDEAALVARDHPQLRAEGERCIHQASARLVAL